MQFSKSEDNLWATRPVFMGNLMRDNPDDDTLAFRAGEVASHETGHNIGFDSTGQSWAFVKGLFGIGRNDLMNEGQGMPTRPKSFDASNDVNKKAIEEINKLPEYKPAPDKGGN